MIKNLIVAGKSYRAVLKSLDIHQSTARQFVYKWRQLVLWLLSIELDALQKSLQMHNAECL